MTRIALLGLLTLAACAPSIPDSGAGGIDAFETGAQSTGPTESGSTSAAQNTTTPLSGPSPTDVQQSNPTPIAAPQGAARYECDTGATVFANTSGRSTTLTFGNGDSIGLSRIQGASVTGATYAGGGWIWFVDGDNAVLTEQGGQTNCRVSSL